jgi:hypothetical protein
MLVAFAQIRAACQGSLVASMQVARNHGRFHDTATLNGGGAIYGGLGSTVAMPA